ncbi:MAG TPA: hypothetical protein VLB74_06715 [Flavobacterium sp.]|uniref:hypothetical protein n=1 Tax=Flavobacterium sp. TaxID=239 RepID=UPI002C6AC8AC|nr:hypothetical protein [Flavobacterium sp.]HSD14322.1 hypothetical protein [Flavobacterium sp.]
MFRKESLYQLMFILCVAVPYANIYELTFLIWAATIFFTLQKSYSLPILKLVACFSAILGIALIVSFFNNVKPYNFIRDFAYILKPIFGLLVGYQLCKNHIKSPLKTAVYAGLFIAVIHLSMVAYSLIVLGDRTMPDIRLHSGYYSDFEVYVVILLLFYKQFEIDLTRKQYLWFLTIIGLSSFLYLARTNFIQFVILYLAVKGYLKINERSIVVMSTLIISVLIGYTAIYYYNPKRGGSVTEALLYKIKNAPIEPFKTKIDVNDWKDFNDNYRSYENILTVQQVTKKGTSAVFFGEGLGSSIDLKREVWLLSSYMRYIPFLHNGYMTVFLKSGLLGVLVLLISIGLFFVNKRTEIPLVNNVNLLFLGTGFFLIISYWVFMGFYFVPDSKSVFIGALFAFKSKLLRNHLA